MRRELPPSVTYKQAAQQRTVPELSAMVKLLGNKDVTTKQQLVDRLAGVMLDSTQVLALYQSLDTFAQSAVAEAVHDPDGHFDGQRFQAKYGGTPVFFVGKNSYNREPTRLRLFFADTNYLPTDLRTLLLTFVPKPPPLTVKTLPELPATVTIKDEKEPLRVRERDRAAQLDFKAVLRLADNGEIKVSDKTYRPSAATMKAILGVLSEGDFYTEADEDDDKDDPASNLTMMPFAWPLLLQAGGLAKAAGGKLQLTPAGRKAFDQPAHEVLSRLWAKWCKTDLLDEFNRIEAIKGQQSRGALASVAPRRAVVSEVLTTCPCNQWLHVDEFFRQIKAGPCEIRRGSNQGNRTEEQG